MSDTLETAMMIAADPDKFNSQHVTNAANRLALAGLHSSAANLRSVVARRSGMDAALSAMTPRETDNSARTWGLAFILAGVFWTGFVVGMVL